MIVRHVVEELLGIKGPAQQEGQVAVRRFDDVRDLVDSLPPVERRLIRQPVLDPLYQRYPTPKGLRHPRQQCWVNDGGPPRGSWGVRRLYRGHMATKVDHGLSLRGGG